MARTEISTTVFHILVALAGQDRHGYSVMQDVAARTDGRLKLSPGTLYGAIRRLLELGLIQELDERPDPQHDDERRRYYRLTAAGYIAAAEEAARLDRMRKTEPRRRVRRVHPAHGGPPPGLCATKADDPAITDSV